jgi:hypothetical protein
VIGVLFVRETKNVDIMSETLEGRAR